MGDFEISVSVSDWRDIPFGDHMKRQMIMESIRKTLIGIAHRTAEEYDIVLKVTVTD